MFNGDAFPPYYPSLNNEMLPASRTFPAEPSASQGIYI